MFCSLGRRGKAIISWLSLSCPCDPYLCPSDLCDCPCEVESLYPRPGWVELDPEVLWSQFTGVIKEAVQDAGLHMRQISGLGISTQRGTFITWHKRTGKPFHNFISWQDLRSAELVNSWNNSLLLKGIHVIFTVLHFFTGNDRYLAPSFLTFSTHQTSMKLSWVFKNIHEAEEAAKKNSCCFGTVDTWLLYRLTKGSMYATDYSNASSTGIFEPFTKCWNPTLSNLLSIPMSVYPPVKDTSCNFGSTDSEIFGVPIPIMAVVADQQSATFGECCFHPGDVKLTMGTGGFWNVNTGEHLFASRGTVLYRIGEKRDWSSGFSHQNVAVNHCLYPLIGWKIGEEVVYLTEGSVSDIGTAIQWAQDIELFTNVDETAEMAQSIADSQGVCFIPGFQVSGDDPYLCASFMGLKPSTNRNHLVRAILESLAFRNKLLYDIIEKKVHIPLQTIRADGGVSNNSFVMQMTSDLINKKIEKPANVDMSSLGAAFLAGLASGFWTDKEQLKKLRRVEAVFEPQKDSEEYKPAMDAWLQAMKHLPHW
ncbi:putative glycerol kinase 5 isoform X2 [Poecile atricapillus]|uniref:putative glycerol kinase 5 isoform X2 n=1 Tax=Poecile atricapillus TaxID=48891 RepID=UPI0027390BFE|nr:putative glycerol kinase 5 isoform X2 [Poecile atricapillus]